MPPNVAASAADEGRVFLSVNNREGKSIFKAVCFRGDLDILKCDLTRFWSVQGREIVSSDLGDIRQHGHGHYDRRLLRGERGGWSRVVHHHERQQSHAGQSGLLSDECKSPKMYIRACTPQTCTLPGSQILTDTYCSAVNKTDLSF